MEGSKSKGKYGRLAKGVFTTRYQSVFLVYDVDERGEHGWMDGSN